MIMKELAFCPCGKKIFVPEKLDMMAVAHEIPYCLAFIKLEPHEFLRYVRLSMGITDEEAKNLQSNSRTN